MIYDVAIIGGGPAGLAAGLSVIAHDKKPIIIERESRAGGILKQCIHEGFGLEWFKERLTGPEYVERFLKEAKDKNMPLLTSTFVLEVSYNKEMKEYQLKLTNSEKGIFYLKAKAIILANGCRERTAKQVSIHGDRPAGVYTAGTAQYFVNILGHLPCKKCVILGSGDIGLIMARRLTLEGSHVVGVYEVKATPSGLTRNIVQCLDDYDIPLHLSHTVTKVHGKNRVERVTICQVDEKMQPIEETEQHIDCDGVILSVGLIPENEIAISLGVEMDPFTKGPLVDQNFMTSCLGVFSCGNALHVNDLVDYVSESGQLAGKQACAYIDEESYERHLIPIDYEQSEFLYGVPQLLDMNHEKEAICYFRAKEERGKTILTVHRGKKEVYQKRYQRLKPPEMEKVKIEMGKVADHISDISFRLSSE